MYALLLMTTLLIGYSDHHIIIFTEEVNLTIHSKYRKYFINPFQLNFNILNLYKYYLC